jgi:hypothetical protein
LGFHFRSSEIRPRRPKRHPAQTHGHAGLAAIKMSV